MLIPERLEEKLAQDRSLRRAVDDAVAEFGPWLRESRLPFFPDYTNHGAGHVEGVLVTASSLIGDEAWAGVTAADATVLVLAALLHDCALHLTEEGFQALVSGSTHAKCIDGFGDAPWPELWQEFLFSAKRFDDRALTDLFGRPVAVRTPPADKEEMTHNDRLLIGEFVRRHHPRLAHEIAVRGFPGPHDNPIRLSGGLEAEFADLAGLVARSHGLPLRATFDYLKEHYDLREYNGVHAVFLMALLRVADYLQIQAERAPRQVLQVKEIRSPVSRGEWRAHHSVKSVVTRNDDPEAIFVRAAPPDVRTYLRLRDWLGGIQAELDSSWAVLGEVYGRVEGLDRLGLVIRRVRSNLDDERAFSRRVEYVPRRVEFDIARSEILKLLVRPLYGDKPEVGIRELLQNSVDAVRELWDLQEQNPSLKDADLIEQEADVVMWLDEPDESGRAAFTITDRGVGMTEEVITDYFLKVGASYRHSDAWAKQHERPDEETDADPDPAAPRSRVLRSGRFGIGALAAFLLGDEIEVSTRHVTAPTGIRFTTRLDSEPIELRYDDTLKVGTTIRLPLSMGFLEQLVGTSMSPVDDDDENFLSSLRINSWDWYCLTEPSVLRWLGRACDELSQKVHLPNLGEGLPAGWFEVAVPGYTEVHCSLHGTPGLVCNGIKIRAGYHSDEYHIANDEESEEYAPPYLHIKQPRVSVFDHDGNLPLNLTRTRLTEASNFVREISEARLRYFLAYLVVNAPTEYETLGGEGLSLLARRRLTSSEWPYCPLFYTETGASLAEPWNISKAHIRTALVLGQGSSLSYSLRTRYSHDAVFLVDTQALLGGSGGHLTDPEMHRVFSHGFAYGRGRTSLLLGGAITSTRVLSPLSTGRRVLQLERVRPSHQPFPLVEEWSNRRWIFLTRGDPPPTLIDVESLPEVVSRGFSQQDFSYASECFFESGQVGESQKPSKLAYLWEEVIRQQVIPYDPEVRLRELAYAYNVLAPYIDKIKKDALAEAEES